MGVDSEPRLHLCLHLFSFSASKLSSFSPNLFTICCLFWLSCSYLTPQKLHNDVVYMLNTAMMKRGQNTHAEV